MTEESPVDEHVDGHTRMLSSAPGKAIVIVVTLVMALWIVAPNMPPSPARDIAHVLWSPATDIGFEQSWEVFSPNPRAQSIEVRADLEYADGTQGTWTLPGFDPIIGAYRGYRWRKWQERIRLDDNERYWFSTAEWIAEHNQRNGELPTTVRLVRRWRVHDGLTADGFDDGPYNEFEFYVWERLDG